MKSRHWLLSSLALGGAACLLLPLGSQAYTIQGTGLLLGQRDFRIYNNFSDAVANDNVTPDPSFPGALGAVLAIWKACAEWGSRLHAQGNGDPSQPGDLGSGGANFDGVFAGEANGVGGTDDNIFSEISGSSPGVMAYTELPPEDGWRVRFYDNWSWSDGPSVGIGVGNIDIQGVTCHEYGHCLGLGHSGDPVATMIASTLGSCVPLRSIEADDIAGIQVIYGVAAPTKPVITGVSVNGWDLTITGQNFAAAGNEVWFAPLGITAAGTPNPIVVLSGLASSSGGTVLTVGTPANAGDGDVFVRIPGLTSMTLSNGWPVDSTPGPACSTPVQTCGLSPNSYSPLGATMDSTGTISVAQNNMTLYCYDIPPLKLTIFYYGRTANGSYVFGNGTRCIDAPLYRLLPATTSDVSGFALKPIDLTNMPLGGSMAPGNTMHASAFYRDPPSGGANFNTANVLSWTWCP